MEKDNSFINKIFLERWHPFFWIALIILSIYGTTLFYDIVYLDDNVLVTGQYQFNKNLSNIPQAFNEDIFRTPYNNGTFYRPIERLTFMLDAQLGEESIIFMSRFSNVLLHILAMYLLFVLLLKLNLKKEAAFLFTLIFSIHPLTAQTVAFIAGRNDSLLAIFIFPSLIYFLYFLQNQKNKELVWHLSFFALALLTKETAAILPIICAFYALVFIGWKKIMENYRIYLKLGLSYAGIMALWFLIRLTVMHNFIGNSNYNVFFSIYKNLPSLIPAIGKIFLPFNLSVFPVIKDMSFLYGIISLILLTIWCLLSEKRNWRQIIFGFFWFLVFILLTLIKPTGTVSEFSENRIYLPMFGFIFVILGLGWIKLPAIIKEKTSYEKNKKKIVLFISLIIILIFSSITIYRNQYYENGLNFWRNATETSPSFAFNHNNLGAMEYLDGNMVEAEKEYKIALNLNPIEKMAHNNLGLVYVNQNKLSEAEEEYKKEIAINPNYDNVYYNLGLLYWNEKRYNEAIDNWKKTLEINPNYPVNPQILQIISLQGERVSS
ncbi:tetratricopeptide repeat protein [Patescibacteria group bacterium]|nr:tetratricopeptide repeat protein [Patescibacteria group bacterium]